MLPLSPEQAQAALYTAPATLSPLVLAEGAVHVWSAPLDQPGEVLRHFESMLSPDEVARAERFVFDRTRRHFIAGRGLLRSILSRYVGREAGELEFAYGAYGKPALAESCEGAWLRFNVSHSRDLALYAITRDREVGVDLEYMRADLEYQEIAKRFFSPRESAVLQTLPEAERCVAFFNCWTRKESYIKARGKGLAIPLDRFDVSLAPGEAAGLLAVREEPEEASRWTISALEAADGYAAALTVEGHTSPEAKMIRFDARRMLAEAGRH